MSRFQKIKNILDRLVEGSNIGAHGAFWRGTTRDEFISMIVFGYPLVSLNEPESSNLLKALSGTAPFGADTGTSGGFMNRMPSGWPSASEEDIAFIRQWINDGCPDEEAEPESLTEENAAAPLTPEQHNAYWREFDNWAMYQVSTEVRSAINQFFPIASLWFRACHDPGALPAWESAIAEPARTAAIRLLSRRQQQTVTAFYGSPPAEEELLTSYELFGRGELPPDPLRPADPDHKMNGSTMWFIWSAFADACFRLNEEPDHWITAGKAILIGLMSDGVFRGRFTVDGFDATPVGATAIRQLVKDLPESPAGVQDELAKRLVDTGIGT